MYVCLWPVTSRIWGVTKLVSEHGLEVDDSTCVHLAAVSVSYRCCYGVGVMRGPNNIEIDVCFID